MTRLRIKLETFVLLQKAEPFYIGEVESEEDGTVSFPIEEETAARLQKIIPDLDEAVMILLQRGPA